VTAALSACALGTLAGCGGDGGDGGRRALPPPRAGSFEAFDGAGRSQRFRLRVGDTLTAATSDRGVRPCVGTGAGCVHFSFKGAALAPAGAPSASTEHRHQRAAPGGHRHRSWPYQFDPVSDFLYAGSFTLLDATTYKAETGGSGTYSATDETVQFADGPYAEFTGKRDQDKQATR
jgi:hypothetical protein